MSNSDHSINPGLLYSRYYLGKDGDEIPRIKKDWNRLADKLKWEKDNLEEGYERPRAVRASDLIKNKPDKAGREQAAVHFRVRNDLLTGFIPAATVLTKNRKAHAGFRPVRLTTTYPGLLIGLGYNHQLSSPEAINAGFYFDHTTGLPIIPGSTVKGAIRSAFSGLDRKRIADRSKHRTWLKEVVDSKDNALREMLSEIGVEHPDNTDLPRLEREIFDSYVIITKDGKEIEAPLPKTCRTIFHDALIVDPPSGKRVFGMDNITPHLNRREDSTVPDRYVEPTPISLLKVLPDVTFSFAFGIYSESEYRLFDTTASPILSASEKRSLFLKILQRYGIGAKTRQGFGRFDRPVDQGAWPDFTDEDFRGLAKNYTPPIKSYKSSKHKKQPRKPTKVFSIGDSVIARVFRKDFERNTIGFRIDGQGKPIWVSQGVHPSFHSEREIESIHATVKVMDRDKVNVYKLYFDFATIKFK